MTRTEAQRLWWLMDGEATILQMLASRAAIADLVHNYARNVREDRAGDCAALFTQDATFEVRQAPSFGSEEFTVRTSLRGCDAIVAYVSRTATPGSRVCPLIHNLVVEVNGVEAVSTSVMSTLEQEGAQPTFGHYRDQFVFDGTWRFSSRVFTIVGQPR